MKLSISILQVEQVTQSYVDWYSNEDEAEFFERLLRYASRRNFEEKVKENKYAPRMKVGKPQIGRSIKVETVGLGNLKVITQDGNPNV